MRIKQIKWIRVVSIVAISLCVLVGLVFTRRIFAQQAPPQQAPSTQALTQDRYTLKIPDGLAFSDFRGYDTWQDVAPSTTEGSIKSILANPTMMSAYRQGIPANGQAFPDGSKIVKIEWIKKKNPVSQYFVEVPQSLKSLAFIEKDYRKFPDSHGWAYAKWDYDPASATFTPDPLSSKGHRCGVICHNAVKATDYIFTAYPIR